MKSNDSIFHHFETVLDDLIIHSDFLMAYYQDPNSFDGHLFYDVGDYHIFSGITRQCVVDDNYDYVVKYDIEEDCWGGSVCKRETEIYQDACEKGMARYFTSATYIGTYERSFNFYDIEDIVREADTAFLDCDEDAFNEIFEGVEGVLEASTIHISLPLYAYQKAELNTNRSYIQASVEQQATLRNMHSPLTGRNLQVGLLFLEDYGMDEYKRFTRFARKHHINDLHSGNIGFIDNKVCFIDYGGFHDSCDLEDEYEEDSSYELY